MYIAFKTILGFTTVVKTMRNGERYSSYNAFIEPLLKKTKNKKKPMNKIKSLTVLPYSEVEEVLINSDKVAYGVAYKVTCSHAILCKIKSWHK